MSKITQHKIEPHHFVKWKQIAWPYCIRCGLIALKNPATEKAIKKGCIID